MPRKHPHATLQERLWLWGCKTTQTSLCKANWSLQESKPDARLISAGLWITEPTGHLGIVAPLSEAILSWPEKTYHTLLRGPGYLQGKIDEKLQSSKIHVHPGAGSKSVLFHMEPARSVWQPPEALSPQPKSRWLDYVLFSVAAFATQWWTREPGKLCFSPTFRTVTTQKNDNEGKNAFAYDLINGSFSLKHLHTLNNVIGAYSA